MGKKYFALVALMIFILTGCSDEIETPSGISDLPPQPETPRGLTASIGDGHVVLSWTVSNAPAIDEYVVYFSDSATSNMLVYDTTALTLDTVDGLVNGRGYYFRVSAIDTSGMEGYQSTPVAVTPGIFAINIASGVEYINYRSAIILFTAPQGVNLVRLSEDPLFGDAYWQSYGASKTFELSDGDGLKTVYAQFEMEGGGSSVDVISDDIILDRTAVIDDFKIFIDGTVELVRDTLLMSGDTLRFEVHVSEDGDLASATIDGLAKIDLNDFGIDGDNLADDGIFGGKYVIPDESEISMAVMTADFTDVAGNNASELRSDVRLSITSIPPPVEVWGFALSSLQVQLIWDASPINDFSRYRVFRASCDPWPCADSILALQILQANDNKFVDGGLEALTDYYYWVYVDDVHGNSARSDTVMLTTLANEPPDTVTILAEKTGDSTSARVNWIKPSKAEDFLSYYVLRDRSELPIYAPSDFTSYPENLVVKFISDRETTTFHNQNLPDTGLFYYQVYVIDMQGMVSRSNQDTVRVP
jgi:hypothetical protein